KELAAKASDVEGVWDFKRWDNGEEIYREEYNEEFESPHIVIHSGDLQMVVKKGVPDENLFVGHECQTITQNDKGVQITFTNGKTIEVDAVIGADGPRSVVRDAIMTAPPMNYQATSYRSIVPQERIKPEQMVNDRSAWLGPHKFFMRYPISNGELLNTIAIVPKREWKHDAWVTGVPVAQYLEEFSTWEGDVQHMIEKSSEATIWALHDMDPLEYWTKNRIMLIGDAAHFMLPFMGQGACQSIEDAAALAKNLASATTIEEVKHAFKYTEAIR